MKYQNVNKLYKKGKFLVTAIFGIIIFNVVTIEDVIAQADSQNIQSHSSDRNPFVESNTTYVLWNYVNNYGYSKINPENSYENVNRLNLITTNATSSKGYEWVSKSGGFDFSFTANLKGGTTYRAFVDRTEFTNVKNAQFTVQSNNINTDSNNKKVQLVNNLDATNPLQIEFTTNGSKKDIVAVNLKIIIDANDTTKPVTLKTKGDWGFNDISKPTILDKDKAKA
ncbi:hypothetical protein LNP00_06465, partial [Fructobacillus sp. M158]|uniref:hypothetical protein n=1 Tax=Fructobacillus parabroussonetiae TaxID=2713174 RepID=UPI00200B6A72